MDWLCVAMLGAHKKVWGVLWAESLWKKSHWISKSNLLTILWKSRQASEETGIEKLFSSQPATV